MAFNFKHQPQVEPTPDGINLTKNTILITGGNLGMGYETARQLMILRASSVTLGVRSITKGEAAKTLLLSDPEIKALLSRPMITIREVNMAEYKSVVKFARRVKKEMSRLDAVLLNAGIRQLNYELAPTGHEKVM